MRKATICAPLALLAAGCGDDAPEERVPAVQGTIPIAMPAPVQAAAIDPKSPEAAVAVVRRYHALLAAKRYPEAYALWGNGGEASGLSSAEFAASFDKYATYSAEIGDAGRMEGAAGSSYVEVPVQVSGTLASGERFDMEGPIVLRRVNDVPGSTEAQRRWHISDSGVRPRPQ